MHQQSNALVPFLFESNTVRVERGPDGRPVFVAKDVAEALGYTWNGSAAVAHVPEEWKGVSSVLTPRGTQEMVTLTEQGLYFFLGRSDKPKALPFQKWIAGEVVPSIIATGTYSAPGLTQPRALPSPLEDKVGAHFRVLELLSRVPGVRSGIAASVVLDAIHTDTGLTMEPYRKALPPGDGPAASLNATALGKVLGMGAAKTNALLASKGLQARNARGEWELTEAGRQHAEAIPYTRGSHSGYQLLWHSGVAGLLQ
jgi:prophage antirepressor-like protein